jgi:hypothetical protein
MLAVLPRPAGTAWQAVTAAAERLRRFRQRERAGRFILAFEADEIETIALLIAGGFLNPAEADQPRAIAAAAAQQWELLTRFPR